MNTTNVFVELLVIGLGPVAAIVLVALVVLGPATLDLAGVLEAGSSLALVVPFLAITYVLGIIADRMADRLFGRAGSRIRMRYFEGNEEYHTARRLILVYAEPIYRLRQYGRSRMRITRGWTLNLLLLAVPLNLYLAETVGGAAVLFWANLLLALMLAGTTASWRWLAHGEYEKIRGAAEFLRGELEVGRIGAPGERADA